MEQINRIGNNDAVPSLIQSIAKWHHDKGIVRPNNEFEQLVKLREELAELEDALAGGDEDEIQLEMGDMLVVLLNLMERREFTVADTLSKVLAKITKRKGETRGGVFVKEEDL